MTAPSKDKTKTLTPGIPDPDRPGWWLVWPWPAHASFCEVVRHFLTAYVGGLQGDRSVTRQLAYFEGYQAALGAAPTHELTGAGAWQWHNDLTSCIADCVAIFRDQAAAAGLATESNVRRLQPAAPATLPARFRPGRVS